MYHSKLGKLFRSLNEAERRHFKRWLQSPLHNEHKEVERLFEYLFSRRSASETNYAKERVFKSIYKEERPYDDLRMRHLLSLGLDCLMRFVRYGLSAKEDVASQVLLAGDLRRRNLQAEAERCLEQGRRELEAQNERSAEHYLLQFRCEAEHLRLQGTGARIGGNNLQKITDNLTLFFIVNTLNYACLHLSHSNLRHSDCRIALLPAVLAEVESNMEHYARHPVVVGYYAAYKALLHPEREAHFQTLQKLLLNPESRLAEQDYSNLFFQALNYCIKRLNTGEERYVRSAFELYRYGLEQGVLTSQGILSPFAYKNMVALALRLGELDWAEGFICGYAEHLEPVYRHTYREYNTARLHFARGEYGECMSLLARIDYDDLFMQMDSKIILLKIYYEQGSIEALDSLLQSFYTALQRKKIMGYHRAHYKNTLAMVKKLLALRPGDERGRQALRLQMQNTEPLPERPWLLRQLDKHS